ncbi:MAG: SoxY-related AACIE arm protein [Proteobacteria bacterium]|jgi:sulfur-oxidizing protein SoxY|nr:MAG: SoxY-related AACIE arm protein [Pseudomonadota bacterium]
MSKSRGEGLSRRQVAAGIVAVALVPLAAGSRAAVAGDQISTALEKITGGAPVTEGRVKLEISSLAENGFSVPLTVSVDSPMTADDYVKTIHILSEKNPVAEVVKFNLSPRMGRAKVSTSIRMADTQRVLAVAEMHDGSFWSAEAHVIVTLSACIDGG